MGSCTWNDRKSLAWPSRGIDVSIPHHFATPHRLFPTRRVFLRRAGGGAGLLGLACLLDRERMLGSASIADSVRLGPNPLAPRAGHFPAKARSVIWLFLNGGPSQVDTWDYKPEL